MQTSDHDNQGDAASSSTALYDKNSTSAQQPICVLLIDDQAMIGEAVRRMLVSQADIQYHFCPDPSKVFNIITEIKPTVILQDLVMPNVNGLELLKKYRNNPISAKIPVIVLSTREEPKVKNIALSLGANDYLIKLPDPIELIARIRYHSKVYINQGS